MKNKDIKVMGVVALFIFTSVVIIALNKLEINEKFSKNMVDELPEVTYTNNMNNAYKIIEGKSTTTSTEKGEFNESNQIQILTEKVEKEVAKTKALEREEIRKMEELEKEKEKQRKIEAEELAKQKAQQEEAYRQKLKAESEKKKQQESNNTYESNWMTFEASYYVSSCSGCSGISASGVNVKNTTTYQGHRIIASDNNVIPMWSIVEIQTPYETFTGIILDRGGAIKGRKLDILVNTSNEAISLGRHNVKLRIIRNGK